MELEVPEGLGQDGQVDADGGAHEIPDHEEAHHDLPYGDGGNGKIMAFEPEAGVAHDDGQDQREAAACAHAYPRGDARLGQQDRRGIGADAEKGRIAEGDLTARSRR